MPPRKDNRTSLSKASSSKKPREVQTVKIMIVQHRFKQEESQGQDFEDVPIPYVQEDMEKEGDGEDKNPEQQDEEENQPEKKQEEQEEPAEDRGEEEHESYQQSDDEPEE